MAKSVQRQRQRGLVLLEAVLALLILSGSLVIVLQTAVAQVRAARALNDYLRMTAKLDRASHRLLAQGYHQDRDEENVLSRVIDGNGGQRWVEVQIQSAVDGAPVSPYLQWNLWTWRDDERAGERP